jgi:glycosyltransferase involved in cell wall biosynthesis
MPTVTVLMSVYNGMPYLHDAVNSVLEQTFQDWTLLLINDGSTDGSADYLNQLDDRRIRVVHQSNQGLAAALNNGIKLIETEFVARLDADDVALPTRLEKQLAFLQSHPRVGMVGTQIAPLGAKRVGGGGNLPLDHHSIDFGLLHGHHSISHTSIMCRTALLREIGGYWPSGWSEDWDLYLRMGERAELANLNEVLVHYRVVESGIQCRYLSEVRSRISYACELAERRRQHRDPISYEDFMKLRREEPIWRRAAEAVQTYAQTQYRRALPEILGSRPARGYARLAWAATCAPQLTWNRVRRMVRNSLLSSH